MGCAHSLAPQPPAPEPVVICPNAHQPVPAIDPAIKAALTTEGRDKPSFESVFYWDWNPRTGAIGINTAYSHDASVSLTPANHLILPALRRLSDFSREKVEPDQAAISALFEKVTLLKSASMNLTDEDGLEKILAIEIGKTLPADDPSTAFLRNTTPKNLRAIASTGTCVLAD